jgi:hypothetical protein
MKKAAPIIVVALILLVVFVGIQQRRAARLKKTQTSAHISPTISIQPTSSTQKNPDISEIPLTVTTPPNGQTVNSPNIVIKGTTVANAEVLINDTNATADENGNFESSLLLSPGENDITIVANDENGNYAEKTISVTLNVSDSQLPNL